MTVLTPLLSSSSLPLSAAPTTRAAVAPATPPVPATAEDRTIAARVDSQVAGGALSASAGASLKDFFGETGGSGSTGSLMRRADAQLDQFDRVLDKLRASLGGATYGSPAPGSSGMVVDRLA
ncbi:hypothetical protein K7957_18795 [Sphingomonas yunnanensis]|uniref:hypothetical protein n=1 Tax=Sphingomonas yunnanensis TaxID=310400 RepID=UPI001CA65EDC|nr:hypothetical protein [Sphingomonas yunnanensis]MBY9064987.1 hypothetical protein [Sphingomonas yunnanensis]